MKECTEAEFVAFLKSYPRPLTGGVNTLGYPAPIFEHWDETLGQRPGCIVARYQEVFTADLKPAGVCYEIATEIK